MLYRLLVPVVAVTLACASAAAPAQQTAFQQVVLLRNGHLMTGRVEQRDDRYVVQHPDGGRITLPVGKVERVFASVEHAYRYRATGVAATDVQGQLDMARWCLDQRLLDHAARHVAQAMTLRPDHPLAEVLHERILRAGNPPPEPVEPRPVVQASATVEAPDAAPLESLPRGTIEQFTRVVQPLLMNRCASGKCHDLGAENQLRLVRTPPGHTPRQQLTQRNLLATLKMVDRQRPILSPLLTVPRSAHGGLQRPVFDQQEMSQWARLAGWVELVTGSDPAPVVTPSVVGRRSGEATAPPRPDTGETPVPSGPGIQPRPLMGRPDAAKPIGRSDPFDPSLFNQRFRGDKPSSTNSPLPQAAKN